MNTRCTLPELIGWHDQTDPILIWTADDPSSTHVESSLHYGLDVRSSTGTIYNADLDAYMLRITSLYDLADYLGIDSDPATYELSAGDLHSILMGLH